MTWLESAAGIGYDVGPGEDGLRLLDTMSDVEAPERVRFRYQLAGPGRRAVAWLIDLAIRGVIVMVFAFLFAIITASEAAMGPILLVLFVVEWFYGVAFETFWTGRTPGKAAMSLQVVRVDGSPVRFPDVLLRNLLRAVDYLPLWGIGSNTFAIPTFGIAFVVMLVDPKLRRVGDMVAGTVVVVQQHEGLYGRIDIVPPVSEAERAELPATVHLTADEVGMIEEFMRRRPRLSRERAEELAELFGPTLSERTGVQAATWERVLVLAYARATGKDR